MKKGISYIKILLTGIIWTFVYFFVLIPIVSHVFSFDFLSVQAWQDKWRDFAEYRWLVKTSFDFALLATMILWIPVWLIGWWLLCKIKWSVLKPKIKPRTVVKKVLEVKESKPTYATPRPLPSVIQAARYVAPKLPGQQEETTSGQKSHTNLVQMIRSIATVAKKYQVEIFQHILLEGNRVPLAISTDARAVMIEIVNKKNVNWSVEFTDDIMKSSWYSEGGVMENLAQDLLKASASLAKSEPNSEILSAIVLTDGRILNAKQTVEYFKKNGIFLLSFNNGEPKNDILDLPSFLSTYFDLKEGEEDPAPRKVEKVPLRSAAPAKNAQNELISDDSQLVSGDEESSENVFEEDENLDVEEEQEFEEEFESSEEELESEDSQTNVKQKEGTPS